MRSRSLRLASLSTLIFAGTLGACSSAEQDVSQEPSADPRAGEAVAGQPSEGPNEGGAIATAGKQLPPELIAELRLQGADANGRLLTLAPGFVATAECSDCGAPSYLWFLAVRCADTRHCEVLTEQCEGAISRDEQSFVLEFHPVEGGSPELCAGYSGTFEPAR
ncbi:MAG: hypothetical protein R6X02_21515 [Enhygromyxa sp.]